ncbi:MAG: Unknown protein [uncultured Sulfurovum sp.]|uniref:Uncharacterized protein n=1 Tax=uncultured Sulfurovum sp. TaxID=269237 RepID=A0A6S6TDH3_9BACT|nr:MAG: Unknown protein [uncultured Sulfurovum sp.]
MEAEEPLEDLIVIHPHTLQKFMRQGKDFANLLALYTFYAYQAKLQKTNQPLCTDEFTRKGMNWAIDRVKKTKKLLKEMGFIAVVQKGYYSYIKLPFIYTKKKVGELLGNIVKNITTPKVLKKENLKPKKEKIVSVKNDEAKLLQDWLTYCHKNAIRYSKNNLNSWNERLKNRSTLEQKEAIYTAIAKKWKNFYITPIKASKYHQFLGKSLMLEKDCDTLIDIDFREKYFYYKFKNRSISSMVEPQKLFAKYGYDKISKTAPMVGEIKDKIVGLIERF